MGNFNNFSLLSEYQKSLQFNFLYQKTVSINGITNFYILQDQKENNLVIYKEFQTKYCNNFFWEMRKSNNDPKLLKIIEYNFKEINGLFMGFILFEYFDYENNVENQLFIQNKQLKEYEIWLILETVLENYRLMSYNSKLYVPITLKNIFLDNKNLKSRTIIRDKNEDFYDPCIVVIHENFDKQCIGIHNQGFIINENHYKCIDFFGLFINKSYSEKEILREFSDSIKKIPELNQFGEDLNIFIDKLNKENIDLSILLNDFIKIERLSESPKALRNFKNKDEVFGISKNKITTGISIPFSEFSRDFQRKIREIENLNDSKNSLLSSIIPKEILFENSIEISKMKEIDENHKIFIENRKKTMESMGILKETCNFLLKKN